MFSVAESSLLSRSDPTMYTRTVAFALADGEGGVGEGGGAEEDPDVPPSPQAANSSRTINTGASSQLRHARAGRPWKALSRRMHYLPLMLLFMPPAQGSMELLFYEWSAGGRCNALYFFTYIKKI